jgi:hypothetical protein
MVNVTPRPLYPEEKATALSVQEVDRPRGQSGRVGKISPPSMLQTPDHIIESYIVLFILE